MERKTIRLAQPGNAAAQKALKGHWNLSMPEALWFVVAFSLLTGSMNLGVPLWSILVLAVWVIGGTLFLVIPTIKKYLHPPIERMLQTGSIIEVDYFFVEAWNDLRREYDVRLTPGEQAVELAQLYYVARELMPYLAQFSQFADQPEMQDERQVAEATIRARLRREVEELQIRRSAIPELQAEQPSDDVVSAEELAAELRRMQNKKLPPGPTGNEPAE